MQVTSLESVRKAIFLDIEIDKHQATEKWQWAEATVSNAWGEVTRAIDTAPGRGNGQALGDGRRFKAANPHSGHLTFTALHAQCVAIFKKDRYSSRSRCPTFWLVLYLDFVNLCLRSWGISFDLVLLSLASKVILESNKAVCSHTISPQKKSWKKKNVPKAAKRSKEESSRGGSNFRRERGFPRSKVKGILQRRLRIQGPCWWQTLSKL